MSKPRKKSTDLDAYTKLWSTEVNLDVYIRRTNDVMLVPFPFFSENGFAVEEWRVLDLVNRQWMADDQEGVETFPTVNLAARAANESL